MNKSNSKSVNDKISHEGVTLDLDKAIERLMECKPLTEREIKVLCEKAIEVFQNESNVQPVQSPVTGILLFLDLIYMHKFKNIIAQQPCNTIG